MDNKYSNKIKRILMATGWSQEHLAAELDVSFVTLNNWYNSKSEPRDNTKEKIDLIAADVLGVDAVDTTILVEVKRRAEANKCTVKKLVNNKELLERLTTSLTYHSNGTEGSTMTEEDVAEVLYENRLLANRTAMEQREAINHQTALYYLLDELAGSGKDFSVTPDIVKAAHLRMMNGVVSDAGYYRDHGVRIRGASVPLANYIKIPELMENWCNLANSEAKDKINLLTRTHAEFERIHPFSDGNGRTGRLMLFVLALKLGMAPPILRKEKRYAYYKYLEMAQMREVSEPLEMFIAKAVIETGEMIDREK